MVVPFCNVLDEKYTRETRQAILVCIVFNPGFPSRNLVKPLCFMRVINSLKKCD